MDEDLLFVRLGSANESHPAEVDSIEMNLVLRGVEVIFRTGTLAYSPSENDPGRMILDPEASIAALRHEYQHFLDDAAEGFPGMSHYLRNAALFAKIEKRGYLREIETARETGNDDLVPAIVAQMRRRVHELFGGE